MRSPADLSNSASSGATFRPVGSCPWARPIANRAFCLLLDQLEVPRRAAEGATPPLAERLGLVAGFAAELRRLGPANFLYADGDHFAHAHPRRTEPA
ncbi:hypothetical protein G0D83_12085 [Yangia sp. PrR003]|nr:class II glutamine amidotransferase [Salipiger sp. PrR003]NDV50333.1 hypothetical protein [Salipiger sp. PrR003]